MVAKCFLSQDNEKIMVPRKPGTGTETKEKNPAVKIPDRKLGDIETIFHLFHEELFGGLAIMCVPIRVAGPLDIQLVKHACHHLYERHPLLRARIGKKDDGHRFIFDVPFPDIPIHSFFDLGKTDVHTFLEREADTLFDTSKHLWRVLLITDKTSLDKHYLALSLHHSISDGTCAVYLAHELIECCAKILAREAIRVQPLPVRPALEELIASIQETGKDKAATKQGVLPADDALSIMPFNESIPIGRRHTRFHEHVIERAKLTALHEHCLREKTTVHAALAAMTLMAMQKQFRNRMCLNIDTPVSIRRMIDPRIGDNELGCLAADIRLGYDDITERDDLWQLSRHYEKELARIALNRENLSTSGGFDPDETIEALRTAKQFRLSCALTNIGNIDPAPAGPFTIESVGLVSGRQCAEQVMSIFAATVRGVLMLNFAYTSLLVRDSWIKKFINDFLHLLDKAGK